MKRTFDRDNRPCSSRRRSRSRWWFLVQVGLAVGILVPALYGFGTKFREMIVLYGRGEEGAFTLMPILNYLLTGLGFLLLFVWAMLHGMFRNIEQPKHDMLANEERLDQEEAEFDERNEPSWAAWNADDVDR